MLGNIKLLFPFTFLFSSPHFLYEKTHPFSPWKTNNTFTEANEDLKKAMLQWYKVPADDILVLNLKVEFL